MQQAKKSTIAKKENWKKYLGVPKLSHETIAQKIVSVDLSTFSSYSEIPKVAWLGHASIVIRWRSQTILIDPVFAKHIGIVPRRVPVPKSIAALNPNAILVSHGHMDHLDNPSLSRHPQSSIYLPNKTETFLSRFNRERATQVSLGDSISIGPLTIRPMPALHGGWRYPWQQGYLAVSYWISDGKYSIYYAGDSAYGAHFKDIGNEHPINLALIPIGAYSPRWFLKDKHLNPPEAVQAAIDLNSASVIPIHFGSYRLALDPLDEALPWFVEEATNNGIEWSLPCGFR